ncbi:hypothetical protein AAC387_Pa02g3429 [Persea americana]
MHFWKNSNSPSHSSTSPKSSPSSPSKQNRVFREISHLWARRDSSSSSSSSSPDCRGKQQQPRLTRQRKLRHVSDIDIGAPASFDGRHRLSVSANSTPLSLSPSPRSMRSERWMSGEPLPLPLPEFLRRGELAPSSSTGSNSGQFPLPSPKGVAGRMEGEEIDGADVWAGDGAVERALPSSAVGRLSYQTFLKGAEHADTSTGSAIDYGKKVSWDPNAAANIRSNFRLSVPAKSAPASGLSSPVLSPRRMSVGDFFPPAHIFSQAQLQWSDTVLPTSDTILFAHASPEKFMASPERSPLHSPRMRTSGPKSPSGTASPMHPKMSSENSASWHDNNGIATVHPLPLPPGAAVPPQPALVHQPTSKPEASPMISQWKKTKLIGSGTFGNVYVASNNETGALCAMKEVNIIPDDPKSIESVKQLEQEIKVLSKLQHPNIVQYYGSEIFEDRFYIYLEYVHPGSISKYIQDHCGAMTESVVRNFTRHILSGLAYLHGTKTIHRDIKGANLLVDASGVVKLADFGMAKHLSGQGALSLKGSPYWMAPEVLYANMVQKDAGYDLAVDIWSLGCTVIEMFTGRPPWSEFEGAAAMFKVLRNESPPIPETLSPDGKNFLQCCLQKNPADRPSANKLLEHPFIRNSHHSEIHGCIQAISEMKLKEMAHSPRRRTSLIQASPRAQACKGKQLSNDETGRAGTSESAASPRHSPRSNLEAISSQSPPHSNQSTYSSSLPSTSPNRTHLATGNASPFTWK